MDKNRKIKFRAWDKTNKRMMIFDDFWHCDEYQSLAWKIAESSKVDTEGGYCLDWDTENLELMQFTGLLDKNGKEIYDSDLGKDHAGNVWQVWRNEYMAHWSVRHLGTPSCAQLYIVQSTFEIIGNIYSNPELLKD